MNWEKAFCELCLLPVQIILWEVEGWKKRRAEPLHNLHQYCPHGWFDTSVEFHRDQKSFLYADSTSLAIFDVKDLRCEAMVSFSHPLSLCHSQ